MKKWILICAAGVVSLNFSNAVKAINQTDETPAERARREAREKCDSSGWTEMKPANGMRFRSYKGEGPFGGFWEFMQSTEPDEMPYIHERMQASGHQYVSEMNVTCRSRYLQLELDGEWFFDYKTADFVNNIIGVGAREHPADACGDYRIDPIATQFPVKGTVRNSRLREYHHHVGKLVDAGVGNPTWGSAINPEDTEMQFALHGNALASAIMGASGQTIGSERQSFLDLVTVDRPFIGNEGKPVQGVVSGQAVYVDLSIPFPCEGRLQFEAVYDIDDGEGNVYQRTEPGIKSNVVPNAAGFAKLTLQQPTIAGKYASLAKFRYRKLPDCSKSGARLGSIDWSLDLGQRFSPLVYEGILALEFSSWPTSLSPRDFKYFADELGQSVAIYADTLKSEIWQIRTIDRLLMLEGISGENKVWLKIYPLSDIDWVASAHTTNYQMLEGKEPASQFLFSLDSEQGTMTIVEYGGHQTTPVQTAMYRFIGSGVWSLEQSSLPFIEHLQISQDGPDRRVETRWWSDADGNLARKVRNHYKKNDAQHWLLQKEEHWEQFSDHPNGERIVTIDYEYSEHSEEELSWEMHHWDGYWERRTINATGNELQIVTPWMNAVAGTEENHCVVENYKSEGESNYFPAGSWQGYERIIAGHQVERSAVSENMLDSQDGKGILRRRMQRRYLDQGSNSPDSWDTGRYLESEERFYASGLFKDQLAYRRSEDGVIESWDYSTEYTFVDERPAVKVVHQKGLLKEDGTVELKITSTSLLTMGGARLSEAVYDFESGKLVESSDCIETDDFGTPTMWIQLDGSFEGIDKACCNGGEGDLGEDVPTVTEVLYSSRIEPVAIKGQVIRRYRTGRNGEIEYLNETWVDGVGRPVFVMAGPLLYRTIRYENSESGGIQETHHWCDGTEEVLRYYRDREVQEQHGGRYPALRFSHGPRINTNNGESASGRWYLAKQLHIEEGALVMSGPSEEIQTDMLGRKVSSIKRGSEGELAIATEEWRYSEGGNDSVHINGDGTTVLSEKCPLGSYYRFGRDADSDGYLTPNGPDQYTEQSSRFTGRGDDIYFETTASVIGGGETLLVGRLSESLDSSEMVWTNGIETIRHEVLGNENGGGAYTVKISNGDATTIYQNWDGDRLATLEHFNASGELLSKQRFEYDGLNRCISETNGSGELRIRYDDWGGVTSLSVVDPITYEPVYLSEFKHTLSTNGLETSASTSGLLKSSRTYSASGKLLASHGKQGLSYTLEWDSQNRLVGLRKGAAEVAGLTEWVYSDYGYKSEIVRERDQRTGLGFSSAGELQSIRHGRIGVDTETAVALHFHTEVEVTGTKVRISQSHNDPEHAAAVEEYYDDLDRLVSVNDAAGLRDLQYSGHLLNTDTYIAGPLAGWQRVLQYSPGGSIQRQFWQRAGERFADVYFENTDKSGAHAGRLVRLAANSGVWRFDYAAGSGLPAGYERVSPGVDHRRLTTLGLLGLPEAISFKTADTAQEWVMQYDMAARLTTRISSDGTRWGYNYSLNDQLLSAEMKDSDGSIIPGYSFAYSYDGFGNAIETVESGVEAGREVLHAEQMKLMSHDRSVAVMGNVADASDQNVVVNGVQTPLHNGRFHAVYSSEDERGVDEPLLAEIEVALSDVDSPEDPFAVRNIRAILPASNTRFVHDADGNLLEDGRWLYSWNAYNQLTGMRTHPIASTAGMPDFIMKFRYDNSGRRVEKSVSCEGSIVTRHYLYHDNLLALELEDGEPLWEYTYGLDYSGRVGGAGGIGGLLAAHNLRTGLTYLPSVDPSGNIISFVEASNGQVVAEFEYSPYGKKLRATGAMADAFSHGFATMPTDRESGMVNFGQRLYNPELLRWINPDPLGEYGSVHRYQFVGNDPLNRFDPDGRLSFYWHGNWGGPGRVNGMLGKWAERDPFPRIGDSMFTPPVDDQDWCYYGHDTCLGDIRCGHDGNYTFRQFNQGEKACDYQLSDCLLQLKGIQLKAPLTAGVFRAVVGPARIAPEVVRVRRPNKRVIEVSRPDPDRPCNCQQKVFHRSPSAAFFGD